MVGASGSGKSSLINLLCGEVKATVGTGVRGCTFKCDDFLIQKENILYFLTDTAGFDEPNDGTVSHENAIKSLIKFAKEHRDGFNLIVFVMKQDRIKKSFVDTYNFFYQVLFSEEVPCIFYISHTEVQEDIDTWLNTEKKHFDGSFTYKQIICGTTKTSKNENLEKVFSPLRASTYKQMWLAIKEKSREEPFQMNASLSFWAKAFNAVYYIFSWGGKYFQAKVEIDLQKQLREMNVKEETIEEILKMIEN